MSVLQPGGKMPRSCNHLIVSFTPCVTVLELKFLLPVFSNSCSEISCHLMLPVKSKKVVFYPAR
jgi:hypothetical protein